MASHFLDDFDFKYDLEDCPTVEDLKNFCMDINFKRLEVKQKRFKDIRKYILLTNLVERVDHQIRIQQEANQEFLLALQVNYLELSSQLVTSSSQTIYSASPFELNNTHIRLLGLIVSPSSGTWALGVVEVVGAVTHWSRDVCELAEEFGALLPSSLIFADCEHCCCFRYQVKSWRTVRGPFLILICTRIASDESRRMGSFIVLVSRGTKILVVALGDSFHLFSLHFPPELVTNENKDDLDINSASPGQE
ncbi:unnamed protein product [Hermetia illucens]|uniref:Uncharacterized protein n=1 Tax=Hermetia illucens TaxID=343691 RepID=A0A7R8UNZ8_HERIL|nr:unnamed protein product [Hermetia illucens]